MTAQEQTTSIGILIFPGFPMACLASCIEPLRAANEISGQHSFQWRVIAEEVAPVRSSSGVVFSPDCQLAELPPPDHLLFASSPKSVFCRPSRANAVLHRMMRARTRLGAISAGVFPLARTRLTMGHPLSVHWCYETAFKSEFPHIPIQSTVISNDGDFTTISGASAVFDHMLTLIETRLGAEIMTEVACWFQHPFIRGEAISQKVPAVSTAWSEDMLPQVISRAIRLFADHIEYPVQIREVAGSLGISERTLQRQFKAATGHSPETHYRRMRLNRARQLVLYSNETIAAVSHMVGYCNTSTFIRHYRVAFGMTPNSERRGRKSLRVNSDDMLPSGPGTALSDFGALA